MKLLDTDQYRFVPGGEPYSWGVVALPGHEVVSVALSRPLPYAEGFELADRLLAARGRPPTALCGVELRSPGSFSIEGFAAFNDGYRGHLAARGLLDGDHNPVARTNVVPVVGGPDEVVMAGFSFTEATETDAPATFLVAGGAEFRDGRRDRDAIIRRGETSPEALAEKAAYVLDLMDRRLEALGCTPDAVTSVHVYSALPIHGLLPTIVERFPVAGTQGIRGVYARPPIAELEFEMDVRGVRRELRLQP